MSGSGPDATNDGDSATALPASAPVRVRELLPPVAASNAGNVLEWYDFVIFAYLAPELSARFFPTDDPLAGLLRTYAVFAVGYLMRPIGGAVLGALGDRLGRARLLKLSIFLMATPTTLMALLPTEAQIGMTAPVLLVVLRLVQGFSVGGEQGGANCYLVEIAPPGRRGLVGSFAYTGCVFGILLGSVVVLVVRSVLSEDSMASWGWRLPFLGGVLLGVVGLLLRRHMHETPAFDAARREDGLAHRPFLTVVRAEPVALLRMVGILMWASVSFYSAFVWLPAHLVHVGAPTALDPQAISSLGLLVLLIGLPVGGWLVDRFGARPVLAVTALISAALVLPLVRAAESGATAPTVALIVLFAMNLSLPNGAVPVALCDLMPPALRVTGTAVAMNIAVATFGGTLPFVATGLIGATGRQDAPAWYVIAICVVSTVVILTTRGRRREPDEPSVW